MDVGTRDSKLYSSGVEYIILIFDYNVHVYDKCICLRVIMHIADTGGVSANCRNEMTGGSCGLIQFCGTTN